ncbi:hypothetical protein K469DRAFT_747890 [Zopfia rhizophila CBS 207.26]|uniref:Uncharacterized protein n=1 Tax=Zopfia rhizophila CBS 207.26 TaxID=1314779 RepID=A0A6A6EH30_9PEZI|nr:hypothetical protein K469DRAFT_747890 [Zopfia rhizophila CBS 207.26]
MLHTEKSVFAFRVSSVIKDDYQDILRRPFEGVIGNESIDFAKLKETAKDFMRDYPERVKDPDIETLDTWSSNGTWAFIITSTATPESDPELIKTFNAIRSPNVEVLDNPPTLRSPDVEMLDNPPTLHITESVNTAPEKQTPANAGSLSDKNVDSPKVTPSQSAQRVI